jgi:hypothetical protein
MLFWRHGDEFDRYTPPHFKPLANLPEIHGDINSRLEFIVGVEIPQCNW